MDDLDSKKDKKEKPRYRPTDEDFKAYGATASEEEIDVQVATSTGEAIVTCHLRSDEEKKKSLGEVLTKAYKDIETLSDVEATDKYTLSDGVDKKRALDVLHDAISSQSLLQVKNKNVSKGGRIRTLVDEYGGKAKDPNDGQEFGYLKVNVVQSHEGGYTLL